jgi:crossover junction endodeoxyribonuclease RusA
MEQINRQELKLTITDFISVNHYLAYRAIMKGKKPMAMSYKTQEAKDFQKYFIEYVKQQAKEQNWITDPNPFQHYYVDAVFYFPRIDVDCNNYWKVPFDAITDSGVVWVDDNMACERVIKVVYDAKNPRIEYTIYKTDFIGIFDDQEQMDRFEDKCKTCKRYSRNCSILNKAKEGRIQEEIQNMVCSKFKE